MKRLSFFVLSSLILGGICFDAQASYSKEDLLRIQNQSRKMHNTEVVFDVELHDMHSYIDIYNKYDDEVADYVINQVKNEFNESIMSRQEDVISVYANYDNQIISFYAKQLPFLKRHEKQIKQAGAVLGGITMVAAAAYAIKNPKEAKEKLQAAGSKVVEVGGKVAGVFAQGSDKLVNGAGTAFNAAKDRMPSSSTVVNAVRNR
ncbi:hypothetical protein EBU24_04050, partial [bacterium]|nr:hypothetical protein [bacterium]